MTTKISGTTGIDRIEPDAIGLPFSFRNKIINGDFQIAQRGTSATVTGANAPYVSLDRWACGIVGSNTNTFAQVTLARSEAESIGTEATFFARYVCTATSGTAAFANIAQRIEGVGTLSGKQVTVSFTARKLVSGGKMSIEFAQNFGSGGSPSAEVNGSTNPTLTTKIALTTEWQRYSFTTTLPSLEGKVLGSNDDHKLVLHFWFDAGSVFDARTQSLGHQSGTFDIIDVQVEEGPRASPFERRAQSVERTLCERYFESGNIQPTYLGLGTGGSSMVLPVKFRARKRTVPTVWGSNIGYYSGGNGGTTPGGISYAAIGHHGFGLWLTGLTNAQGLSNGDYSASAEI